MSVLGNVIQLLVDTSQARYAIGQLGRDSEPIWQQMGLGLNRSIRGAIAGALGGGPVGLAAGAVGGSFASTALAVAGTATSAAASAYFQPGGTWMSGKNGAIDAVSQMSAFGLPVGKMILGSQEGVAIGAAGSVHDRTMAMLGQAAAYGADISDDTIDAYNNFNKRQVANETKLDIRVREKTNDSIDELKETIGDVKDHSLRSWFFGGGGTSRR